MNNRFKNRLVTALGLLIVIVLAGLIFLLGELFKSFYINTFTERMEREASLISSLVDENGAGNLDSKLETYSGNLGVSITIIGPDGDIMASSETAVDEVLLEMEEFREIIHDGNARFESFSVISEENGMFYYAYPILKEQSLENYVVLGLAAASFENFTNKIWGILISSLGLAFIIIFTTGYRITKRYTEPIESAANVAMELARGNYSARTYEDKYTETSMLSRSVNILAVNLQKMTTAREMQQSRLKAIIDSMGSGLLLIDERGYINLVNRVYQELFEIKSKDLVYQLYYEAIPYKEIGTIVEDVFLTEDRVRKQMTIPLNIEQRNFEVYGAPIMGANQEWKGVLLVFHDITELKRLEQMRKDFVANVSHELRTPITSIRGFSETLLDGALNDPEATRQFLTIIHKESERLQNLINDLLDLSKIEQQQFKLVTSEVDIVELLREVILIVDSKAREKGIDLQFNDTSGQILITGDVHRLKQVFINLISNGINYTRPGGKVEVTAAEKNGMVEVVVADTGIGISEEEFPRIFERFYRVDKARSRNSGGTGLGLAIVKHLVEAHEGKITVESSPGKGTAFTVHLKK
ncbi:two-component system histidine kinase PnpS [Bacillus marinisedimentorum]|uniref:two-component system histidine kinase PnpS n=1 Tax=Bacillus marinisedimentorum TaxID=1821260 RepID=UPI0008730337|nr:ATP-binding protein [Bacillus marinisedimentorum]